MAGFGKVLIVSGGKRKPPYQKIQGSLEYKPPFSVLRAKGSNLEPRDSESRALPVELARNWSEILPERMAGGKRPFVG